ncbi:hypothetical protein [Legionella sp. PC997]|uniref:hypothetical protein n=1 Tax=Legionella sp. PC997 TaxID=2755562 RepID=UPI0015F80D2F|nr:hypothetical protein [Legionella sp. PC997]QMT59375.1 hypothetical protein HBNCFIEN_00741 [Legionella sp. PC997]
MREKSKRKAQFQASPIGAIPSFDEHETSLDYVKLGEIFAYYRNKLGIRLIRNGDFNTPVLQANIKGFAAQLDAVTAKTFPYYNFLKICEFSDSDKSKSHAHLLTKELNELYSFLKSKGFLENNRLKEDLKSEQILEIENFCQTNLSAQAKAKLEGRRKRLSSDFASKMHTCCLTKEQAIDEMLDIQKSLGEDEMVGYVFTNNVRSQRSNVHFEAVIITKHEIIKPVEWGFDKLPKEILDHTDKGLNSAAFFSPRADLLSDEGRPPQQQVDQSHSGALCVLYLKKLLQGNGKALFEDSLRIPLYDENNKLNYVFIPPPNIMQYSQNDKFIKFYQMLMGRKVEISSDQPTPHDLQQLLLESRIRARLLGDHKTAELNQNLIDKFDTFSEKWLRGCDEACEKRDAMLFIDNDETSYNIYLAYAAKRLLDKVRSPKEERVEQDSTTGKKQKKEQEATNVLLNDSQEHAVEARVNASQKEGPPQTSIPQTDRPSISSQAKEKFKEDLQDYVFKRMSEAGSHDFAAHHRTKIITLKFGYSAEQKIAAVNKLIYALDMQDKLEERPKEMKLTETDIGALTTSRLYENVIKKHLELFNQILEKLPENHKVDNFSHDI